MSSGSGASAPASGSASVSPRRGWRSSPPPFDLAPGSVAKLPPPPPASELAEIPPEIHELPAGSELWRLYFRGGAHPTLWHAFRSFGPLVGRFDHHLPGPGGRPRLQERAVLYAAASGLTSLAELFQDTRTIDRNAREPWLVAFRTAEALTLLDLTGAWPTRAGASMALASGPRPRARRWARGIYLAYPGVQGLWYPSSMHANRPSLALWERGAAALPEAPVFHRPLADATLLTPLKNAAQELGYLLI